MFVVVIWLVVMIFFLDLREDDFFLHDLVALGCQDGAAIAPEHTGHSYVSILSARF